MQPARRVDDELVEMACAAALSIDDATGVRNDTQEMRYIVGGVVPATEITRMGFDRGELLALNSIH